MQVIGPRTSIPQGTSYSADQILAALFSPAGRIDWSFDRLDPYGNYIADLSPYVSLEQAPQLQHDATRAVATSLQLSVRGDSGLDPEEELLRLHARVLMAANDWVDVTLATLVPQLTGERSDSAGKWLDIQAVDPAQLLVDSVFDPSYSVAAGTDAGVALASVIGSYGGLFPIELLIPAINRPVPVPLVWEAGKSRLQAANDLLAAFGYMPLWFDELGRARSAPLPDYSLAQPVFAYDLGSANGLSEAVSSRPDPSKAFRKVLVLVEDPNRAPFAASYTFAGSSSVLPSWRPKTRVERDSKLADYPSALAYARSLQQQSLREAVGVLTVPSLLWPFSQHLDLYSAVLTNPDDGPTQDRYVEARYRITCKPGGAQMSREWQTVVTG